MIQTGRDHVAGPERAEAVIRKTSVQSQERFVLEIRKVELKNDRFLCQSSEMSFW